MAKHKAISRDRFGGGLLLGAVASGALAVASLGSAGAADATCASISGVGNSADCQSTATSFAIGLGPNTIAKANGLFDGAIAIGITNGATDETLASSTGNLSLAYAGGKNTEAVTNGNLELAAAQGDNLIAIAGGLTPNDTGNVALNLGQGDVSGSNLVEAVGTGNIAANVSGNGTAVAPSEVVALGTGNSAFNIAGNSNEVSASGVLNNATNVAGNNNKVVAAGGTGLTSPGLNVAFNTLGNGNTVTASPGPLAIAGAIGQTGKTVTQTTTGIHINP